MKALRIFKFQSMSFLAISSRRQETVLIPKYSLKNWNYIDAETVKFVTLNGVILLKAQKQGKK